MCQSVTEKCLGFRVYRYGPSPSHYILAGGRAGGRGAQSIRETFPKQKPKSRFGCTIPPNQENLLPKTERLDLERPWMREAGQLDDLVSYAGIRGDGGDEGQDQDQ